MCTGSVMVRVSPASRPSIAQARPGPVPSVSSKPVVGAGVRRRARRVGHAAGQRVLDHDVAGAHRAGVLDHDRVALVGAGVRRRAVRRLGHVQDRHGEHRLRGIGPGVVGAAAVRGRARLVLPVHGGLGDVRVRVRARTRLRERLERQDARGARCERGDEVVPRQRLAADRRVAHRRAVELRGAGDVGPVGGQHVGHVEVMGDGERARVRDDDAPRERLQDLGRGRLRVAGGARRLGDADAREGGLQVRRRLARRVGRGT